MNDDERCWRNRFHSTESWCTNRGDFYWPGANNSFAAATRWCSVHRHRNDVRLSR